MLDRLCRDEVFDEPLHAIAHGPVPIEASPAGTVALSADGTAVLIVWLDEPGPSTAADIADHLDLLATMGANELQALSESFAPPTAISVNAAPERQPDLLSEFQARQLNRRQKAIVVMARPLGAREWETLLIELGHRLAGVYIRTADDLQAQQPPPELLRTTVLRPAQRVLYVSAVIVALALAAGGGALVAASRADGPPQVGGGEASATRTVAAGVPLGATNCEWIGQQRVARTSDGRLVVVYPTADGIAITSDDANQGRTWKQPTILAGLNATSLSIAVDEADDLHVAFYDPDKGTRYVSLIQGRTRDWGVSDPVTLDEGPATSVVDVAYDTRHHVAHVFWSKETSEGEQPHWAAVTLRQRQPVVVESRPLAPAAGPDTVLGNVDVLSDSTVLISYRTSEGSGGWFSRTARPAGSRSWRWERAERLPTDAYIGAASVAVDSDDTAHLILRDSSTFQLLHFSKPKNEPWGSGATVVDAERTEEIDYPAISVDTTSDLLYVFFQHRVLDSPSEIRFVMRDSDGLWQGPFNVQGPSSASGAAFPAALPLAANAAFVVWTSEGEFSDIRGKMIPPP